MKKLYAFIFIINCFAMTGIVFGATSTYEFDGVKLSCENSNNGFLKCRQGNEDIFVMMNASYFIAFDKIDPPQPRLINKVLENGKLVYARKDNITIPKTQEAYKLLVQVIISNLDKVEDDYAKKVVKEAKGFLSKSPTVFDKVNIVLNENEKLSCERGATREKDAEDKRLEKVYNVTFECTYYSCKGNDPSEKTLFYMPQLGTTLLGPSIILMKDGQARFYDNNFNIVDSSNDIISGVDKSMYSIQSYNPVATPIDPELLIPSKYNKSTTSYGYLQQYAGSNFADPLGVKDICADGDVRKLFEEEKKIASDMKDFLAYADIIAYVKSINGDVRALYIDKEKAMKVGCYFQDKIIDTTAIPELERMQGLSGVRAQEKYPSEKDVQKLFQKATKMSDIPFGYKYDGCYARAHIMARRFEEMGVKVKKAWIKGDLSVPGTDISWGYHVAPMIEAKDSKGNIVQYVIDPSVTNKAVTLDEWAGMMEKKGRGPVMKTTYPIAENGLDFERTTIAVSSSDPYGPIDMKNVSESEKMHDAEQVLAEYTMVLENAN